MATVLLSIILGLAAFGCFGAAFIGLVAESERPGSFSFWFSGWLAVEGWIAAAAAIFIWNHWNFNQGTSE